jgi:hypothetical protein
MRESQMKKIIAAAVASAFVAPAFAADVTLSGYAEYAYVDESQSGSSPTNNEIVAEDGNITIKATEEINGMTISYDYSLDSDGSADGGNSLDISGEFGKISIGETNGAIDAIDDKADVFKVIDNGIATVSNDANINWALPSIAEGLSVYVAYTPKQGDGDYVTRANVGIGSSSANTNQVGSVAEELSGISAVYSTGGLRLGYGQEDVATAKNTYVTVGYSVGGLGFNYETAENKDGTTTIDVASAALTYSMGDTTFMAGSKTKETNAAGTVTKNNSVTSYGVQHTMGSLILFAETASEDKATTKDELTAIGIGYSF